MIRSTEPRPERRTLGAGRRPPDRQAPADRRGRKRARDVQGARHAFGGFTNQDQSRHHQSIALEWRGDGSRAGQRRRRGPPRHILALQGRDHLPRRRSGPILAAEFRVAGNYGEGIAQPSFFDLFGFFPGSFIGNPELKPESSRGGEISLRYAADGLGAALTYFRQRLKDEIVDGLPSDFHPPRVNADGKSKRQGIEVEGCLVAVRCAAPDRQLCLAGCQRAGLSAARRSKEQRRPKHSGSIAVDGASRPLELWRGDRLYRRADRHQFRHLPARLWSKLDPYWLASARVAYRVDRSGRSSSARRQCLRRRLSGCGRLSHRREEHPCRASRRYWRLAPRSASRRSTCAPTNICCCSPGRRRSPASAGCRATRPTASLWRLARRFPGNRGDLETALKRRPNLLLTMGGGGRATALIAGAWA